MVNINGLLCDIPVFDWYYCFEFKNNSLAVILILGIAAFFLCLFY